ncbi:hypothetical protein LSCM1_04621 [Leishmania martiniquensis]|uniref:RTR1-type domain-containing protein n=1 Tax=Leishmania martiniquensis TaxID=1580590 RepID=A0A836KN96_9TRYP|nr:hypothetical protein LSCM1_04621 [Leishmania martiniquensis]
MLCTQRMPSTTVSTPLSPASAPLLSPYVHRGVRMSHSATESAVKSSHGIHGGAWEAIIDKAVSSVTEYLASTTRAFDPEAPLSQHMLRLVDRGGLRDILMERNYNELCGCLGCGNKPRGLLAAGSSLPSFEWASLPSVPASDTEDADSVGEGADEGGDGAHRCKQGEAANSAAAAERSTEGQPGADAEEIVYEDDLYTAESFRLAQRQRALLNRMQHKKLMREQKAIRAAATSSGRGSVASAERPAPVGLGGIAPAASGVLRSGLLGASFSQRFCSPECEETYEASILRRVSRYFTYDYPSVFGAITNLFPNLRVAALQKLAGAETSAAGLVKPVQETPQTQPQEESGGALAEASASASPADAALKPVQVGVSFESLECSHRHPGKPVVRGARNARGAGVVAQTEAASSAPLLREALEQMHVLQHVWNNEVVPRFSGTRLLHNATAAATAAPSPTGGAATAMGNFRLAQTPISFPPRPLLRGSPLLCDFTMNTSSAQTRRLFCMHYARSRSALQRCLTTLASPRAPTAPSLFCSVSAEIVAELEKRYVAAGSAAGVTDDFVDGIAIETEAEDLRVDPMLQQQRRELLVSHIFSEDVASTLSRLLFLDYAILCNMAWSGVWFSDVALRTPGGQQRRDCSLLRSLQFTFAIPAVLLQEASSTPEVLGLAMIFLVAAGCCSEGVWRGCMREEVAFDEVSEAIGLTREDIAAAVRSLVLGEEL